MRLSTRARYGMRAMLALALAQGQGPVMAREIAQQQGVPISYLEQLLALLGKAKLVTSTRGARGGYVLARAAAQITVLEVISALEGPLDLAECGSGVHCSKQAQACALQEVWAQASQALARAFQGVTLAALAERQRAREAEALASYSI